MRKTYLVLLIALLSCLVLTLLIAGCGSETQVEEEVTEEAPGEEAPQQVQPEQPPFTQQTYPNIQSPHYISSDPVNNALLSTSPAQVRINFNFTVAPPSEITVTRDGVNATAGATTISTDRLALIVAINAGQTGNYKVDYKACWPDGSCHNGSFGFSVKLP
ncbi:MAG: hypothetical protein A2W01_01405 [Candidatus Solincola sediminis]|uniref:CopC domain-containing protein n=1 Tax=Candidatus Solincola sediminis TaxID=1797199 RepID=A0A1F2WHH2_9ACTN|nr:MAG: hypothetical protein A2Y75_03620 [Candidatus Solincola sediminis]OFW58773.1 MAG: hypothetical protein A2W01_01405 [Candidatus Solincola sediminis]